MPDHLHKELSSSVEPLSATKERLLAALLHERANSDTHPSSTPVLKPLSSPRDYSALSFAQERMWFLQQLEPESDAYHICRAIRVSGPLNLKVLEQAISELIVRHSVLRTNYREQHGEIRQHIAPAASFSLPIIDLQSLSKKDQDTEIDRWTTKHEQQPFNLEDGPVIRVTAIRLGPRDHVILFAVHHIAFDGWSMNLLFAELPNLYREFNAGRARLARPQALQYSDYAEWQRAWIEGPAAGKQLEYWLNQLRSANSNVLVQQVGADRPTIIPEGGKEQFSLSKRLLADVHSFATRNRLTSYMVYLAALVVLLHKYTGHNDICVGTPIANRRRPEIHDLIGMFVNTLVMRATVTEEQPLDQFIQELRKTVLDGLTHQEYPFERLVKALAPDRSSGTHPLFQTMLVLQNGMSNELLIPDCEVAFIENKPRKPIADLTFTLAEDGPGASGWIDFDPAKFDQRFIKCIADHYCHILAQLVSSQNVRIHDIKLLTDTELKTREKWNETWAAHVPTTIPDAILDQALLTPDSIAVVAADASITYQALADDARHLEAHLVNLGVGPETRVGICADRSAGLIVGLLGILSAGGAYVPLDPSYPQQRLEFMVQDSDIGVLVLGRHELIRNFPSYKGSTVFLDTDMPMIRANQIPPVRTPLRPSNAMYVIYTSGSTGRPKGVINTHGGISNRLQWMHRAHPGMATGRILQKTSIGFDVSVWELFLPLMYGGTLVFARPGGQSDAEYLATLIHDEKIETAHFVPSMLRTFLGTEGIEELCQSLKWLICSGEELTRDLMERCFERISANICNLYGPTEAAIDATTWLCTKEWVGSRLPIGRPIDNLQMHVLDPSLNRVPIGVLGELYIGGVGVARGYVNRPDLTAERFLPDPYTTEPGARMYKTGDLGCYTNDGEIIYYGRSDHQVKIRGNRIELEEIEAVCRSSGTVNDARAITLEYGPEDTRIVVYVVATAENFDEQSLRRTLKDSLPSFMLPAAIVRLSELPLTASQKLDRQKLPRPHEETSVLFESPNSELTLVDKELYDIWRTVLQVAEISPEDNFFDLGGHSLLLVQVKRLIAERTGTSVTMLELFTYPTPRTLGQFITSKLAASGPS